MTDEVNKRYECHTTLSDEHMRMVGTSPRCLSNGKEVSGRILTAAMDALEALLAKPPQAAAWTTFSPEAIGDAQRNGGPSEANGVLPELAQRRGAQLPEFRPLQKLLAGVKSLSP